MATALGSGSGFALAQSNDPPCPDRVLAPYGLAPDSHCKGTGCLVEFKNHKWWTAFTFNKTEGYYNGGLGTTFAPEHVAIIPDGMTLTMAKDWKNNTEWAGAEAVLMFKKDGSQANYGYGDYLVTAELVAPPQANWTDYDPNVAFGLFTYERPATGSVNNSAREIDLAEISRWGWNHTDPVTCPFTGFNGAFDTATLCKGNAQFALQDYTKKAGMVHRYDIGRNADGTIEKIQEVTLVMRWRKGQVTFDKYHGKGLTLATLPATPDEEWVTPTSPPAKDLSAFVPAPKCQRFHINLWLGNYIGKAAGAPHDGPTNKQDVTVLIKNFEFKPAK
ncbi:MAG TPA: hypothetical protein VFE63_04225 [Roseiarcus sp.]|nr:hypothetical protein [Roseiarcus sp.]